ncbi:MBL fold metallo-hydrolase [Pedobacter jamesrossensis]|uniref:MBL fold metallo-hydrolase n=1 Tax=Pedobacter jamesrossensis TaxID=1908238 RepID=A0ABV8NJN4_9SPHI
MKKISTLKILLMITILVTGCIFSADAQIEIRSNHPQSLPLVDGSTVAIDPSKGYLIKEIKDKVYYATDGIYQVMFILTSTGVVAVDAPPSLGGNLLKSLKEITDMNVTHVIYTHPHPDHIGGAALYPGNPVIITSEGTAKDLRRHNLSEGMIPFGAYVGGKPVPLPTKTFSKKMELNIGGRKIVLLTSGSAAHSGEDVIVFLPKEKIVMMVDIVFPGWIPFEQLAYCQDLDGYIDIQRFVLKLDFDVLVPGHYSKLGTREEIDQNMEYVDDLYSGLSDAIQKTDFASVVAKTGMANIHLMMEDYFDVIARKTSSKVEEKWKGKLSGVDVWSYSNARKLIPYVRESAADVPKRQ